MKTKKAAVITLTGYDNYGNKLQNYALQRTLAALGCQVTTLRLDKPETPEGKAERKIRGVRPALKKMTVHGILALANLVKRRAKHFKAFSANHIMESEFSIAPGRIPADLGDRYDYFVIGSDQIWNPHYGYAPDMIFAAFSAAEKRIAYAPSFGVTQLTDAAATAYQKGIAGIPWLSVREEAGADIIFRLTGQTVPVLADPTMLLTREQWLTLAKPPKGKPKGPYMLTYCLGSIPEPVRNRLKMICASRRLELVNILSIRDFRLYGTDPAGFIDLIHTAECLVTDSFHGAVFAILMHTPFVICRRNGSGASAAMYSRLESLLSKFHFEGRQWDSIPNDDAFFAMDFGAAPAIARQARMEGLAFLRKALHTTGAPLAD